MTISPVGMASVPLQRKPRVPTLRGDFVWTFLGNGIYAVCQWAVLVLLAKRGTPELVGKYAFAVAVATPVITFANLQLRSVQATDIRGQYEFADYLGFRLWTTSAALAVTALLCLSMRYSRETTLLTEAIALSLAIEAISDAYYGLMQLHGRMDRIAVSMMLRGILSLIAISAGLYITGSLLFSILLMVCARVAVTVAYDTRRGCRGLASNVNFSSQMRPWRARWDRLTQLNIFKLTFPVGLVAVLVALNTTIPRYFIEWAAGPRELGIFSALSFFQSSGNMIAGALGQASFVRLARTYEQETPRRFLLLLSRLLLVGLGLGLAGVMIAWIGGRQILQILYRPEYAQRSSLLVFLMVAAAFGYLAQFVGYAVTSARIFKSQIPLSILVAATLSTMSYILVPSRGLGGAILAILIAMIVQLAGYFVVLLVAMKKRISGDVGYA